MAIYLSDIKFMVSFDGEMFKDSSYSDIIKNSIYVTITILKNMPKTS